MNFEETYRKELESVKHNKSTDRKILAAVKMEDVKRTPLQRWMVIAATVAIVCMVTVYVNFDVIAAYAKSLFGNFGLSTDGEKVQFEEIVPINLDYEKYLTDENAIRKGASYYYNYESFYEGLGVELPGAENFEYSRISIDVSYENKIGHISMDFLYKEKEFHMNGRFVLEDYSYEGLGYGEENTAYYVYEYAEGEKAYFVSENIEGHYQKVYFSESGFIFQLMVEDSEEGTAMAKEIIENMVESKF